MPELVEGRLYQKLEGDNVRCLVCPHYCVIKEGQSGTCATRINRGGKLYTLIYGLVSSLALDPIEKKPLFHFYPGSLCLSLGSLGCNLRCIHCQNWNISHVQPSKETREAEFLSPQESVRLAKANLAKGISWTYNEPTIWHEFVMDSISLAREEGLYTVYVTNGYISPEALEELSGYLDAFRVDLKGWSPEFWKKVCKIADPKPIFNAAALAKNKYGMHVEVVTNVIPTYNDDEDTFHHLASWIRENLGVNTPWHITRFVPHLELSHLPPTPLKTLEKAREIGKEEGLYYVYLGNVPGHPGENTYCPSCGSLLIERAGFWIKSSLLSSDKLCPRCGFKLEIIGDITAR